ncbi:MAG: hypothetical protein JNM30_13255, partial [Rhodospirillales bacterium]|nr:hypothetical protein [Rhodospirillales bacterium]
EAAKMTLLQGDADLRELVQEQLQERSAKLRAPRATGQGAAAVGRMPQIR